MLLFLAKQSLLHHSLRGDWWTYEGFGEHMKVFFFTFVFECYQESVMVQPFTSGRNSFFIFFIDFWSFRWSIWHSDFWRRSQIVDLNSVIWILKDRGFELLYRSSSCRFSAEWDTGEVFLLLFFNANKCFNLIGRKVIAVNNKLD